MSLRGQELAPLAFTQSSRTSRGTEPATARRVGERRRELMGPRVVCVGNTHFKPLVQLPRPSHVPSCLLHSCRWREGELMRVAAGKQRV